MKKKILIDAHLFDYSRQGSTSYLQGLYNNFESIDNIDIYLCAKDLNNLKLIFKNKNFKFIQLKYRSKILRWLFEIPYIISKYKFDFAHFNYFLPLILSSKCKYIVTIHDVLFMEFQNLFNWKYYWKHRLLISHALKNASIVCTVSNYSKNQINKYFNFKNSIITPNAVSKKPQKIGSIIQKKLNKKYNFLNNFILSIGRIETRKNQHIIIKIFKKLLISYPDLKLVLVGKFIFYDFDILSEIKSLGKSVVILHDLEDSEIYWLYSNCKIHYYLSKCEGFGIPPLESGVAMCPTICSNKTSMKEYSFFGENHVDPINENHIYIQSKQILNGKYSKSNLTRIREIILNKYSWKKSAEKLRNKIIELL